MSLIAPVKLTNRAHRQQRIGVNRFLVGQPTDHVANIERVLADATAEEWADGRAWYPAANRIAQSIGHSLFGTHRHATVKGAAIIAALSPQTSWDENIVRALALADGYEPAGLLNGINKAYRIVDGANPYDVLGGRKVRSFWHNIVGNLNAVTIDRHALAIVAGHPLSDAGVKCLDRIGCYTQVAAAYRTVARRHNLKPAEVQAITWLAWRREYAWNRTDRYEGTF